MCSINSALRGGYNKCKLGSKDVSYFLRVKECISEGLRVSHSLDCEDLGW